jgi:DNA-binding SARP family transcriptional activator
LHGRCSRLAAYPRTRSSDLLAKDLLPGWDEDWLQLERERHRQLRIHALEALSQRLTSGGQYAAAIDQPSGWSCS